MKEAEAVHLFVRFTIEFLVHGGVRELPLDHSRLWRHNLDCARRQRHPGALTAPVFHHSGLLRLQAFVCHDEVMIRPIRTHHHDSGKQALAKSCA